MTQLVNYDAARHALQLARSVDEVKDIKDKAEALRAYARQSKDVELERWVAEIKLRATRRIGELSAALPDGRGKSNSGVTFKRDALKMAGLTSMSAHRAERVAAIDEGEFERYIADSADRGRAVTAEECTSSVLKRSAPTKYANGVMPDDATCTVADLACLSNTGARFGTIYADPPWLYGNQSTRASTGNHYDGMSVEEICDLPIAGLAAESSHLHLWTTNGFLFDAKRVIEAWGFEYRSCFVWVKPQMGIGNYWRVSHEFMLLGVRNTLTFADRGLMSWGEYRRGPHSAKPEEIRAHIERASPGPRLELFGRRAVDGWTVWGNQIERNLFHPVAA